MYISVPSSGNPDNWGSLNLVWGSEDSEAHVYLNKYGVNIGSTQNPVTISSNGNNLQLDTSGNLTAPGNVTLTGNNKFENTDDGYLNLRGNNAGPTPRIHLRNYNDDPTSDVNVHLQTGNAGQTFELFMLGANHATYPYSGGLRTNSTTAPIIIQTDTDNANNTWEFGLDGTLTTPGGIVPNADNAVDLGSPTMRFRHLYVAPGTIYLGDIKLTNLNGKLEAKKVINPGEENEEEDQEDSDAFSLVRGGGGGANTGDVQFGGNTLYVEDGNGYQGFLNLQNDDNEVVLGSDTTAPIKLGIYNGEDGPVIWTFGADSTLQLPGDLSLAGGLATISSENNGGDTRISTPGNLIVNNSSGVWTFDGAGNLTLPAGGDILDSNGNSVLGSGGGTGATNEITNTDGYSTYSVSVGTDGVVSMTTSRGGLEFGALPEVGGPTHFHVMKPAGQMTDLFFGDDYNYVRQRPAAYGSDPGYGVEIGANDNNGGNQHVWRFETDGNLILPAGGDIRDSNNNSVLGGGGNSLAPELTKSGGNLVATTTLEFQGNMYGAIFDIDSGGNFDVWLQTVTGDGTGKSYAIGSNDDGYNFVYAFSASGTVSWKVGLDDILSYDNTAYGIKYKSGYLYLSCQYYNNDAGENQISVLKLNANDGTVADTWILTNTSNVQYRPRDIAVTSSGDPVVVGESWNETQTFSGLTPQTGSGSQVLVVNASDINNLPQINPWGSYYVHTDPNDPSAWYYANSINHFKNVPTVVVTGSGNGGLTVDIRYMYSNGNWVFDWVTIEGYGAGYNEGDQVKVLGSSIGGTDGVDDIIMSHNGWYMNVLSVGGVSGNLCPSFVSNKVRINTDQVVDYSTGTWDIRVGLGGQAFVWTPNWQHSYGDTTGQDFKSVSVDSSDNIYLLGYFEYYDGSNYHNVLAMKLNSSGVQQWTKYIEGDSNGSQDPGTITVDSSGNSYVISQNNNGYTLVTKLDTAGDLVWQVKQTDNNNWNNYCVGGLDSNGDVIVMGSWYGNNNNNYVTNIHKLSGTDGSLVWSRDFANQQDYDMYEYYDEDGQAGHVVGDNFYYGGYCYDANDDQYVGFGFRLPADGTGTGTYGRYVYSTNNDTQYEDNTSNAVITDHTYNAIDGASMISYSASASTTADEVGGTTSNHWFIGTGGGLTGVDSITFSDGTVLTTADAGGGGWTPGNNIVQTVDNQLRVVVKDPYENYYDIDLAIEDDSGNVKSRLDINYSRIQIETNNGQRQWEFNNNGEFRIPGNINTYNNDINIVAMYAGGAGNITIKTVANYNNVEFSAIDITQNGVNITTD
jgi:hypothetical protein